MLNFSENDIKKDNFDPMNQNYLDLLKETKSKIQITRINFVRAANREQFNLYWWLGRRIVEAQEKFHWGKSVVEQLSLDLRRAFPESTYGFSTRNLWEMRRFYLEYKNQSILQQLVAEIPWGHNLLILNKVKALEAKQYYLEMSRQMGWTRDVLLIQINSQAYERHLLAKKQNNFQHALPEHLAEQADRAMKDIYMLDTLGLTSPTL